MEKNKELTPMQEAIQLLKDNMFKDTNIVFEEHFNYALKFSISTLESLLPKEKQVIEDAFTSKCEFMSCENKKQGCKCGQEYYNNNFKNN